MKRISLVAGLGFGDEGKGSIVDTLVRKNKAGLVLRYNGGPQAAHNVVSPEGVHHCFSQFGSGSLVSGVLTYLSRFMLINPLGIIEEGEVLNKKTGRNHFKDLLIDGSCPVVTPYHKFVNRIKELCAGNRRKGSCGKGVGEAFSDSRNLGNMMLFAGDLVDKEKTRAKLNFIRLRKLDVLEQLLEDCAGVFSSDFELMLDKINSIDYLNRLVDFYYNFVIDYGIKIVIDKEVLPELLMNNNSIFEGAQGALLDPLYGFWPHVTPTKTTFVNALTLLEECGFSGEVEKIGILRAYATRHGNGPFPSCDDSLREIISENHNNKNEWQGDFRFGWLDLPLIRYALETCGGVDMLAITCLDQLRGLKRIKVVDSYDGLRFSLRTNRQKQELLAKEICDYRLNYSSVHSKEYVHYLEDKIGEKIGILSFGPKSSDKKIL